MTDEIFCKRCLYGATHPLGITFDEEGVCSGCRIHEEKDYLDWDRRWKSLKKLIDYYKSSDQSTYDCVIPVTGANDSHFIVHVVKNLLGLNPLLVCYNKYFNTPLGIRNLANLRIKFNCDILYQNVNPHSVKKIIRVTLHRFGSIYWPILAGHTVWPVQVAVKHKIPLIIWGAHQGLEQVGMFSHRQNVEMTRRYRKDHDLMGSEASDLVTTFNNLNDEDVWQYHYPSESALEDRGVRGIYLGNYVRWDPLAQHNEMVDKYDYQGAVSSRTIDTFDYGDCFNYMNLHDLTKIYKHGYSKITDHMSREIRFGRITRKEACKVVLEHENNLPEFSELFTDWLGITPNALEFVLNQHRNPKFWNRVSPSKWLFNGWSKIRQEGNLEEPNEQVTEDNLDKLFKAKSSVLLDQKKNEYITFGKGWPL